MEEEEQQQHQQAMNTMNTQAQIQYSQNSGGSMQSQYHQPTQPITAVAEASSSQTGQAQGQLPGIVAYPTALAHQQVQQQQQQLQMFWQGQMSEIEQANEFKNHQLPLARIKKIMKADEDVRMISAEAPVLFAKACEMFILELTLRSWMHTEENKRRTLQKNDIAAAITRTDIFDFLVDIVPRDELNKEDASLAAAAAVGGSTMISRATIMPVTSPGHSVYEGVYYLQPQQQQQQAGPAMTMLQPQQQQEAANMMSSATSMLARPTTSMAMDPTLYQQQQLFNSQQPMQQMWQQQQLQQQQQQQQPQVQAPPPSSQFGIP